MPDLSRREFLAIGAVAGALPPLLQEKDGLVVHEWGVVTVPYGSTAWGNARSAGARALAGKEQPAALPDFVATWDAIVGAQIEAWKEGPPVVDKPVVYFYAPRKMTVSFTVAVPAGRPKAWWPHASEFAPQFKREWRKGMWREDAPAPRLGDVKPEKGLLRWSALDLDPDAKGLPEAAGWWLDARQTDATPLVCANAAPDPEAEFGGLRAVRRPKPVTEKFLFYDALTPVDPGLEVEWRKDGAVAIRNGGDRPVTGLFAVRVKGGACASAPCAKLDRGAKVELSPVKGEPALAAALVEAGLYRKEAEALVKIWAGEFFAVDGARVLAIAPRELYDRLLPAEISPAPREFARVLVLHVECLDPDRQAQAAAWIGELASESLDVRDAAMRKLRELGPLGESMVRRAADAAKDAEVKARLLEVLK